MKRKQNFIRKGASLPRQRNRMFITPPCTCHAVALSRGGLVTRWPCHEVAFSRSGIFMRWPCHTVAFSRGGLVTRWPFHGVALSHGGLFMRWPCHAEALSRSGLIKEWLSHAMALSHGQILIVNIFQRHSGYVHTVLLNSNNNELAWIKKWPAIP